MKSRKIQCSYYINMIELMYINSDGKFGPLKAQMSPLEQITLLLEVRRFFVSLLLIDFFSCSHLCVNWSPFLSQSHELHQPENKQHQGCYHLHCGQVRTTHFLICKKLRFLAIFLIVYFYLRELA